LQKILQEVRPSIGSLGNEGEGVRKEDAQNKLLLVMQSDGNANRKIRNDCVKRIGDVTTKNDEISCGMGEGEDGNCSTQGFW
jgi:hypothetical protein